MTPRAKHRTLLIGLSVLTLLEILGVGGAGVAKFQVSDAWVRLFAGWGYPAWAVPLVGAVEIVGVLGLLWPRAARWCALTLLAVMAGAFVTVLTHPGTHNPVNSLIHIIALTLLFVGHRRRVAQTHE